MSARAMSVVGPVSPGITSLAAVVKITKQLWSDALACIERPLPARWEAGLTEITRTRGSSHGSERRLPPFLPKRRLTACAADTYTSSTPLRSRASRLPAVEVKARTCEVRSDHEGP